MQYYWNLKDFLYLFALYLYLFISISVNLPIKVKKHYILSHVISLIRSPACRYEHLIPRINNEVSTNCWSPEYSLPYLLVVDRNPDFNVIFGLHWFSIVACCLPLIIIDTASLKILNIFSTKYANDKNATYKQDFYHFFNHQLYYIWMNAVWILNKYPELVERCHHWMK